MHIDSSVVLRCTPAIWGLKAASLFTSHHHTNHSQSLNDGGILESLNGKDVGIRVLKKNEASSLVLVYNRKIIDARLADLEVQRFLSNFGYSTFSGCEGALDNLGKRCLKCSSFPHEIGIFLGYPLNDVKGFLANKGRNYKYCGHWKVYDDVLGCKQLFSTYEQCQTHATELFNQGASIKNIIESNPFS